MAKAAIKATAYCLNFTPELGLHYGTTTMSEHEANPSSPFLAELAQSMQSYEEVCKYAPNLFYIGALGLNEFENHPQPFLQNMEPKAQRFGQYGEIMPEDEFLGLMAICDAFELIKLEKDFVNAVRAKLEKSPVICKTQLKHLETGADTADIEKQIKEYHALPLYLNGKVVGCCCQAHGTDPNLSSHVMLENIASKAGSTLALLHLIKNSGLKPEDIDFVVECSEEAAGDINQRGGGNMAKAVAESAGCVNASGLDVRCFCAGPVNAMIAAGSMVACGARKNVAVVSGGAIPKLYMNSREHVKNKAVPLENCLGCFAVLLIPDDGVTPVMRLECLGKHTVGAGSSPQAITSALVYDPLQAAGLTFADVDKYAPELHIVEITQPAGAGNVPEANYKMIAALAVMKGQMDKAAMMDFIKKHGLPGFAHTQGHIPSGVPFVGHAVDAIKAGDMKRTMIIGKGSLFLGRLTNLADGASFFIEAANPSAASVSTQDIKEVLLAALSEIADDLSGSAKSGR